MKITQASYMDDDVIVPGILVKRFLRKPIFYACNLSCGWNSQVIDKDEQRNVINTTPHDRFYLTIPEAQRSIIKTLQGCIAGHYYCRSILEQSLKLIIHQQSEIEALKTKKLESR